MENQPEIVAGNPNPAAFFFFVRKLYKAKLGTWKGEYMKTVKRKSVGTHFSICVQPAFIVGTNNEDGTYQRLRKERRFCVLSCEEGSQREL